MIKIVIVQYRLLHYRLKLFEILKSRLRSLGIELVLVCGQPSKTEEFRGDTGDLDWAVRVNNIFALRLFDKDLVWQPMPPAASRAELIVVMQENRILSNYWLQIRRALGGPHLAFWGHGRNYQSTAPNGLRERWKNWWLGQVDWWFAYTKSCSGHIVASGFPAARVTTLENSIDGSGFERDLLAVSSPEIACTAIELGLERDSCVAIYCGSIYAEKRIALLLESADLLRIRLRSFHLIVLGDGPESEVVKAAAVTRPWLHVMGPKKGREKALYYRMAQVMLNPGAVGLHIVDAFVAGTPLVTQRSALHGPEYDYLVDGRNGRSVPEEDAEAYAGAVAELFGHPTLLAEMRDQCARDAVRYTLENMVENFVSGIVSFLVSENLLKIQDSSHA